MDKHSLIQITQTLSNLERAIVENNGELTPELEAAISIESISKEKKIDAYFSIMERCKSIETELNAKITILDNMVNNVKAIQNRLKSNIKEAMAITGTTELQGEIIRFKLSPGGTKLVITNEDHIPVSYYNERVVLDLDKPKLKADLESGASVDGCTLEKFNSLRTYPAINSKKLGE